MIVLGNKEYYKGIGQIKFEGKDLNEEKIDLVKSLKVHHENRKLKISQMNDYGIEIARGLLEMLNGNMEIQINPLNEIILTIEIPIHLNEVNNSTLTH